MQRGTVYSIRSNSREALSRLLNTSGLPTRLENESRIIIKPNLVEALQPPITTPVDLVDQLIIFLQSVTDAEIIIAEGSGATSYDTFHTFTELGYTELADKHRIELIDLNEEVSVHLQQEDCLRWPEMYLPEIVMHSFLLSVPVLKAHSLAKVTLTMKNMMGCPPPAHYQQGNSWKKSSFHSGMQEAVADLNRYRTPDFTLLDASIGMARAHLWGPTCDPPVGLLVASHDPVAIDAYGASLLHRDWREIGHINELHGELGQAEPLEVIPL